MTRMDNGPLRYDNNRLGKLIRSLREEKKMSRLYLSFDIGSNEGKITKWERGETIPRLAKICKIADALEVPHSTLLGNDIESVFRHIGDKIQFLREYKMDMTRKEFSEQVGIGENRLRVIESGVSQPSPQEVRALEQCFSESVFIHGLIDWRFTINAIRECNNDPRNEVRIGSKALECVLSAATRWFEQEEKA